MTEEGEDPGPPGTFMDLAGVRTYVKEAGEGGVPLVLLHGVLSDGSSWSGLMDVLSQRRRVLAPDAPLHGRSIAEPAFSPGPRGMADWLEALLDAIGAPQADILGLSMGGAIAAHFALLRSERVRRLILLDAANVVPMAGPYMAFIEEMRGKMQAAIGVGVSTTGQCWTEELGFEGAKTAAVDLCTDPIVMGVLEYLEARGIPFGQVVDGLDLLEPLAKEQLGAIRPPTMAVWGAEDPFFPADEAAQVIREALPACRLEVLEGVGHNPASDDPEALVRLVEDFLA